MSGVTFTPKRGAKILLREKVAIAILIAIGFCGCAHEALPTAPLAHDAAGCLTVCPSATYVELSPKGDLCRCWAPSAFTFTFLYPDDPKIQEESRSRWMQGKSAVAACIAKGQAWEPSEDHRNIVCLEPSAPEPEPIDPLRHTMLNGRNKPAPRWLRVTPWESWRPKVWRRSA